MEPIVTTSSALPDDAITTLSGKSLQPLPRRAVLVAFVIAAALPAILLVAVFGLMVATNYNFLNWME